MALIAIYWFFSKSSVSYMLAAMQMFTLSTVFYFGYILNTNEEIEITRFAAVINILLLLLFIAFGVQSVSCPNQGCEYFMFANGYILGYTLYQSLDYLPITLSIFIMLANFYIRKGYLLEIFSLLCFIAIIFLPSKTAVIASISFYIFNFIAQSYITRKINLWYKPLLFILIFILAAITNIQGAKRTFEFIKIVPVLFSSNDISNENNKLTSSELDRISGFKDNLNIKNSLHKLESGKLRIYDENSKSPHNQFLDFKIRDPFYIILPLLFLSYLLYLTIQIGRSALIYKSSQMVTGLVILILIIFLLMFTSHVLTQPLTAGLLYLFIGNISKKVDQGNFK